MHLILPRTIPDLPPQQYCGPAPNSCLGAGMGMAREQTLGLVEFLTVGGYSGSEFDKTNWPITRRERRP